MTILQYSRARGITRGPRNRASTAICQFGVAELQRNGTGGRAYRNSPKAKNEINQIEIANKNLNCEHIERDPYKCDLQIFPGRHLSRRCRTGSLAEQIRATTCSALPQRENARLRPICWAVGSKSDQRGGGKIPADPDGVLGSLASAGARA